MSLYSSELLFSSLEPAEPSPVLPGEIWQISPFPNWDGTPERPDCPQSSLHPPLHLSEAQIKSLYSDVACQYLAAAEPRHVLIVQEPQPLLDSSSWQMITVLILSSATQFLSQADLVIPSQISGIQTLLAETWHIVPMLVCQLAQKVGNRLPRLTYDTLIDAGDAVYERTDPANATTIEAAGLQIGSAASSSAFHQQERDWSDVLTVPVAIGLNYLKGRKAMQSLIREAIVVEESPQIKPPIQLGQWLQGLFETRWQDAMEFPLAVALRSGQVATKPDETNLLLEQLNTSSSEWQRIQTLKRLGELRYAKAVDSIVNQIQTATDAELIWSAVDSLRQINPRHPAIGIRRMQRIELCEQRTGEAVALVFSLLLRDETQVHVLLQLFPVDAVYLPSDLTLAVLDSEHQILREVTARSTDGCIQLKLSGQLGEFFSVQVTHGTASITELFVF
jgi:hypothetical protein